MKIVVMKYYNLLPAFAIPSSQFLGALTTCGISLGTGAQNSTTIRLFQAVIEYDHVGVDSLSHGYVYDFPD